MTDIIRLQLPGSMQYLSVLAACVTEMLRQIDQVADAERTIYNIQLAIHEGCTNIVRHAYQHDDDGVIDINLTLACSPRRLVVELTDSGTAFNLEEVSAPNLDDAQVGGYGLFLMRQLMDEVSYETRPHQNYWRLTKYL